MSKLSRIFRREQASRLSCDIFPISLDIADSTDDRYLNAHRRSPISQFHAALGWNWSWSFVSPNPPSASPLFLAYRERKGDEEAARDASDGAGCREESSRPATGDKAKAHGGKRGPCVDTDTFIPASITALAVDSFLVLTCATRDRAASCISRKREKETRERAVYD